MDMEYKPPQLGQGREEEERHNRRERTSNRRVSRCTWLRWLEACVHFDIGGKILDPTV